MVLSGVGSFLCADALLRPALLSRAVLAGMTVLWLCWLLAQFFAYDTRTWKGDRFRTSILHSLAISTLSHSKSGV